MLSQTLVFTRVIVDTHIRPGEQDNTSKPE